MTVWSKILTPADLEACAEQTNEEFPGCALFLGDGLQLVDKRSRRIERVHLRSSYGLRRPNPGTSRVREWSGELAASWTEWGWFLARVFERDPHARCGDYRGAEDFHAQTGQRFTNPWTPRERQVRRELARQHPALAA
jgi:hypothetical protein